MSKRKILIQLDTEKHASVFDRVVAVDAGADEVFSYSGVERDQAQELVHGAIFTRGPADLKSTAIFVGGRHVVRAEEVLAAVTRSFVGPMRCSVMLDANGANTTAAAAVLAVKRHLDPERTKALVLGGTGPVGQRVALLMARGGASVWLGSRSHARAEDACVAIQQRYPQARVFPFGMDDPDAVAHHPERFHVAVSAGAAGVRLLQRDLLKNHSDLKLLVDLNAVPPTGIEGVEVTDAGREADGIFHYGAIGIGGAKMKIHKAALASLFEANDRILDAEEILDIGLKLGL